MNKNTIAEVYFIVAIVIISICLFILVANLWQRGPDYERAASIQEMGQTTERPRKGQTEEDLKGTKEGTGGRLLEGKSTGTAIRGSLLTDREATDGNKLAGKRERTVPESLGSGKDFREGFNRSDQNLAYRGNSTPSTCKLNYSRLRSISTFKITAYTAGYESTGKNPGDPAYGITASGEEVIEDHTIASDWDVLPPGSVVFIDGVGVRTVTDKGGAVKGRHIDIYIPELNGARNWGVRYKEVWLIRKGAEE